ncbi:uncharacterized protein LOC117613089 isoform X2 [Prunus dulcis]|uniref:uncharacterized protein LOC117613089 isoform X2 n=1 Tax=Prunus dulcis TaxID=3755 RepID=UPI00148312CB|nr:uncharacterized protein LOC117613089 isoform X2 [Prunus dulcis]
MASASDLGSTDDYEALMSMTDVELLKRAWRQEKAAPEILQFESRLIKRVREQIQLMIEKYMFHIFATAEILTRLSKEEKWFIERCCVDLQTHLEKSVLSQLPYTYQSIFQQSVINDETDMVAKPQLDTFIVCKTKYYLGHIQLEDNADGEPDGSGSQKPLEEPFEMEPNVLYFVRYKAVKKFVEEGKIDLY